MPPQKARPEGCRGLGFPLEGSLRVPLKGSIRVPLEGSIRVPLKGSIRVPLKGSIGFRGLGLQWVCASGV